MRVIYGSLLLPATAAVQIQLVGEGQLTFSDVFLTPTWGLHLGSPADGGDLTLAAGTTRALYGSPSGVGAGGGSLSGIGSLQCPSPLRQRLQHEADHDISAGARMRDRSATLAAAVLRLKQRNRVLASQREGAERDRASAQNFVLMLQQENAQLKERSVQMSRVRARWPKPFRKS